MEKHLKLTIDVFDSKDGGYIGVAREIEGVVSQGETLEELDTNIIDAARAMLTARKVYPSKMGNFTIPSTHKTRQVAVC